MLRTYFLQQWFSLSDPGMEEAFYESPALRRFAGVDLGVAAAPDETTILRFRHLLEQHDLGGEMRDTVNRHLPPNQIQKPRGRTGQAKKHDQGPSASQSGASISHPEARLRIYQSTVSRLEEEP